MAGSISAFYLVDQVLIGHQRSDLMLGKNLFCAVARLALLGLLVLLGLGQSDQAALLIVLAYTIPMVFASAAGIVFLLPAARAGYRFALLPGGAPMEFITYSFASHIYEMLHNVPSMVLPLMVANVLGLQQAGSFYIAWTIAIGLSAIPTAAGYALFAQGSQRVGHTGNGGLRFALGNVGLSALVALAAWLAGPTLLLLYGKGYQETGDLLRLLVVSIGLVGLNSVYVSRLRVLGHLRLMLVTQVVIISITLGGTMVLMSSLQLMGIGWAWLAAQVATTILLTLTGGSHWMVKGLRKSNQPAI
jgi:O-antigen/teichoic acid export membrane protein